MLRCWSGLPWWRGSRRDCDTDIRDRWAQKMAEWRVVPFSNGFYPYHPKPNASCACTPPWSFGSTSILSPNCWTAINCSVSYTPRRTLQRVCSVSLESIRIFCSVDSIFRGRRGQRHCPAPRSGALWRKGRGRASRATTFFTLKICQMKVSRRKGLIQV